MSSTCAPKVMDIENEGKDDVTLETLRWIHRHKTGALLKVTHNTRS